MSKKNKLKNRKLRDSQIQSVADTGKKEIISGKSISGLPLFLRPHILFAFLAFFFGSLFIIYTPPYQVPDEIAHFDRAFKLSEFGTYQKTVNKISGDYIPKNIDSTFWPFRYLSWNPDKKVEKKQILDAFKYPLNNNDRTFIKIDAGAYFYLSYIPQFPAIYLGKLFELNILTILYLGRFFGLLFYILCVYQAIRKIPFAKYLMSVIALMPMCLAQAGSSNADCVLYAFCFLALAILLKYSFSKDKLALNKETALMIFILLIIGVLKIVYLPLVLLIFLLPFQLFKTRQKYFAFATVLILLSAAFTIAWTKSNTISFDDPTAGSQDKIRALMNNPFLALSILNETVPKMKDIYYHTTIGVLGYLDTVLPEWMYKLYTFLVIFVALFEGSKDFKLKIYQRLFLFSIPIIVFTGIILSMYLINGKENGYLVSGVQGRYFIPVIFPFFLAFTNLIPLRLNFSRNKIMAILLFFILFVALLSTHFAVLERYYE